MIVLCPKAFSSDDRFSEERDFLKYFLSRTGRKGVLADEVWETFRFRLIGTSQNMDDVDDTIADFKGVFTPEDEKIGENGQEIAPTREYDLEGMVAKTNSLLDRRWADIDLFITTAPESFEEVVVRRGIKTFTLQEFFLNGMNKDTTRSLMQDFWQKVQDDKWSN